jgi:23S rRNA (adenine2503-C2)-methyltransferase
MRYFWDGTLRRPSHLTPMVMIQPLPSRAPNFYGLTHAALAERFAEAGHPAYRATQVYGWVYQKGVRESAGMSSLSRELREHLSAIVDLSLPEIATVHGTRDGMTQKFVLRLEDGARVECVAMRTERRLTFCISSQVGCALKCSFCATGLMGLERNLRADEIVAQVVIMADYHEALGQRFNLVFMGMGEPLANERAVFESIRIMREAHGLGLGARRITVSTSGLVPGIEHLAETGIPVGLAISLHATTDALRSELVPVNKRWPLDELLRAARAYGERSGRRVTLEYTLLAGVNDGPEDADRLSRIARDLPSKINLIPYNPVPGLPYRRPTPESVQAFAESLYPRAPAVMVRHTLGGEIWAACGQLGGLTPAP